MTTRSKWSRRKFVGATGGILTGVGVIGGGLWLAGRGPGVGTGEMGDEGRDAGLTAIGREVVREMNRLGMVIDLGHASLTTARAAAELSTAPIIQSHSLIRREGATGFGMTHDHARLIADTGGVIGAFGGTPNRDIPGYADNILYMTEVVGIDHVGLGSDMDGTGGRSVWDRYAQAPAIVAGLLQRGMSEDDVAKVIGGNALRVLREVAG